MRLQCLEECLGMAMRRVIVQSFLPHIPEGLVLASDREHDSMVREEKCL